jgi:hypothetical protein
MQSVHAEVPATRLGTLAPLRIVAAGRNSLAGAPA